MVDDESDCNNKSDLFYFLFSWALILLILKARIWDKEYDYPHFTSDGTEAGVK